MFKRFAIFNTLLWLFIATILPNLLILFASFTEYNEQTFFSINLTLDNLKEAFSPLFIKVYINSMLIGVIVVLLCLLFGYYLAYIIYLIKNKILRYCLLSFVIIPFWTSSLIRTYSLISIFRLNGLLNKFLLYCGIIDTPLNILYNWQAVIFGYVYTLIPFMVISIYLSLNKIDYRLLETAKDLGASSWTTFFKIILPLTNNGIVFGCSMVLLSSFSMFYLSDLLGGSKYQLIGNLVRNQFLITHDWNLGSAITIILYFVIILFLILQKNDFRSQFNNT